MRSKSAEMHHIRTSPSAEPNMIHSTNVVELRNVVAHSVGN